MSESYIVCSVSLVLIIIPLVPERLFLVDQNRYERYAQKKGWKFEVVDITESDLKGYKVISLANFNFI